MIVPCRKFSVCPKSRRVVATLFTCTMPTPTVAPAIESTMIAPASTNPSRIREVATSPRSGSLSIHTKASGSLTSRVCLALP